MLVARERLFRSTAESTSGLRKHQKEKPIVKDYEPCSERET